MKQPDTAPMRIEHLEAQNAALIRELETAVESIGCWACYAPGHLRVKHEFYAEMEGWKATIKAAKKGGAE